MTDDIEQAWIRNDGIDALARSIASVEPPAHDHAAEVLRNLEACGFTLRLATHLLESTWQAELHEWRQWGQEWVAARHEREGWTPVPGTMPPAGFGDKPRELNRRLDEMLAAAEPSDV